jgi:16S rRNA (cytidine1402-2'-O)-methyltransferase
MAVVLSGLPVHSFTYRGFAPHKGGPRRRFLQVDATSPHTLVFYESPYRVEAFLRDALEVYGDRAAAVVRELTKIHETIERGTISELLERVRKGKTRGEYVIVIGGAGRGAADPGDEPVDAEEDAEYQAEGSAEED